MKQKLVFLAILLIVFLLSPMVAHAAECCAGCPNGGSACCSGESCSASSTTATCTKTYYCGMGCTYTVTEKRTCSGSGGPGNPKQQN